MATAAKRPKVSDESELGPLQKFLQWCDQVNLVLNSKVKVSKEGTVAEYGMLATEDIAEGEVLFTIPRTAILHQRSSEVSGLLDKEKSTLESSSGWVPLLLALLYEYTSPRSHWRPYLSLWTDFKYLDPPMFWSTEERERLLKGTGIPEAVDRDLANIRSEYTEVVLPFIQSHPEWWNPEEHTLELYTQLVAFVMAYSFQEPQEEEEEEDEDEEEREVETAPNPPMMVPMADMLNHVANHNANLEFTPDCLKMVCVRPVRTGQEVFNTYGQMANWQLLHMYGFAEPHRSNCNDTADVPAANLFQAATQGIQSDLERQLKEQQWEVLCQMMADKTAFVFGKEGCLTDTELHTALKVLSMTKEEFSEFTENEGWEEDEDEDQVSRVFSFDGFPEMKPAWKWLVHEAARLTLQSYGDEGAEPPEEDGQVLNRRHLNASRVRHGQKSILSTLMKVTERP